MHIEDYCYGNFIKKGDIAYDIGAHIGEVSTKLIDLGASKVFAFEPSETNFAELQSNTKSLNIECHRIAFHEKEYICTTRFKDCRRDRGQDSEQEIKYAKLDNYIISHNIDLPQFVKMDIEGMEGIVYKNIEFLLTSSRPVIYTEFHIPQRHYIPQDYEDNPHWRWPDNGGYDFNNLKKHNYSFLDKNIKLVTAGEYNPECGHHGRIFIPNEKISTYLPSN